MDDPGKIISKIGSVAPSEVTGRALFLGENIATFSGAASYKVYRRTKASIGLSGGKNSKWSSFRFVNYI